MFPQIKALGFIGLCLIIIITAKALPSPSVSIPTLPATTVPLSPPLSHTVNTSALLEQFGQRPIFTSKANDALMGEELPLEQDGLQWTPLDYDLIGVSRSNGQRTGWFKHKDTNTLVSARQGMHLGDWALNQLTKSEARLENNGEKLSLKLFANKKPR